MKTSFSQPLFRSTFSKSKIINTPNIVFRVSFPKHSPFGSAYKLGFLLNKSLGKASRRNLFKRRARFLFHSSFIKKNYKIFIIIRPKSINLSWAQMCASFKLLIKKL
ncbi:MAG: hypothetical protein CMG00_05495 [Candidatus Marinimicrobia bacterium]|nr:hypothetical protein [Candidatus Neomarinimicrobiota bacterium]